MNKEEGNDVEFNPSQDEQFVKHIDEVFAEEPMEQVDINHSDGDDWIDIEDSIEKTEADSEAVADSEFTEAGSEATEDIELIEVGSEAIDAAAAAKENDDDLEIYEKAIHNIVHQELEEDEINDEAPKDGEEDIIVEEISNSLTKEAEGSLEPKQNEEEPKEEKKKMKLWMRILIPAGSLVLVLVLFTCFLFLTTPGKNLLLRWGAQHAANNLVYEDGSNQQEEVIPDVTDPPEVIEQLPEVKEEDVKLEVNEGAGRHEDYAVNILLLGEEAIDSGTSRGRTDVMMIATLNSKEKSIKLTSLMRDLYVQIPGHLDNKLNSVYATGGIQLLYDTIALNFDVQLDGYCLVGFNDFEKIIDLLDGIDVELSSSEAYYLNVNNYVSNPKFRTLETGMNHMNGNQALGYCRIRYVSTPGKESNDYGRTSRHRTVMNAIFNKYKSLGFWDLAVLTNSCLPMITTDLDAAEIESYLKIALDIGLNKLDQNRIPAKGTFDEVNIRKMDVLVPNLKENVQILHDFIFGAEE